METKLSVIGISHHTAAVELREQFALPAGRARELLRTFHDEDVLAEALVLDTCNRTEVLFVPAGVDGCRDYILSRIARLKAVPLPADRSVFYRHDGLEAVSHLFGVAAALDSQIVGDRQILRQVKSAYRMAVEERTAGGLLNKLLHRAFGVGKRVQTETQLGFGAAGIGQAAVELARRIFPSLEGKTVLFVGAGETAQLAARAILRCGAGRVIVANRTLSRARRVADDLLQPRDNKCPPPAGAASPTAEAIAIEDIPSAIAQADLAICSTGSPGRVLTPETVGRTLRSLSRPVFIIDIAVPRDVDPRLGELPNVSLSNIDEMDRMVARNIERRSREIPRARAIVSEAVREFAADATQPERN